jgi:hypothetical protein
MRGVLSIPALAALKVKARFAGMEVARGGIFVLDRRLICIYSMRPVVSMRHT